MYLGGFAGFASAWAYENTAANPNGLVSILIATLCAIAALSLIHISVEVFLMWAVLNAAVNYGLDRKYTHKR